MSSFLTVNLSLTPSMLVPVDERAQPEWFRWNQSRRPAQWTDGRLWPNSRMMCGDPSVPICPVGGDAGNGGRWGSIPEEGGGATMKKIIGITKDQDGVALGNCIVQGFLTANDQFLRQLTSDVGGYYELCSEYPSADHYLVAYKAGAPDVTGATVNTLVPV